MKYIAVLTSLVLFLCASLAFAQPKNTKTLVVYFSLTGTTKAIAENLASQTNADIFEIEPVQPYPKDYSEATAIARVEQRNNARPAVKNKVANMDSYDIIYLGYPIWYGTMPMAVFTFLSSYDLKGKKIIPFSTSGSTTLGRSIDDLKKLAPNAVIYKGYATKRSQSVDANVKAVLAIK
jgi:flavodoxin